jgi:arylsulfatase A-like enzyme
MLLKLALIRGYGYFLGMKIKILYLSALILLALNSCNRSEFKISKPNILFILLDTTRADHLGSYGYERDTSPNLDQFAAENLKAKFALATAPWTPASVASMFTGLYPASHGMMPPNDRDLAKKGYAKLSSQHVTLAEILKGNGYRTAAVSPNPWVTKEFGYDQGFDEYYYLHRKIAEKITESGRELIDAWTQKGPMTQPFFMYLHFLDPHDSYSPPGEYATKFSGALQKSIFNYDAAMQKNINLYDGEINYLDAELGKFFDYLKQKGLYEDLFIVIVADHGEQFMEHGDLRHGYKLFNEEIHVPLMIKTGRASDKGRAIKETVSTLDILPTVLERIGIKDNQNLPGVSLLNSEELSKRRGVMSEIRRIYDLKAITDNAGNRLILSLPYNQKDSATADRVGAWNEAEIVGVFSSKENYACNNTTNNPAIQARLVGTFDETLANALYRVVKPDQESVEIKDETLDQLKSLGYLQ